MSRGQLSLKGDIQGLYIGRSVSLSLGLLGCISGVLVMAHAAIGGVLIPAFHNMCFGNSLPMNPVNAAISHSKFPEA